MNRAAGYDITALGELLIDFTEVGRSESGQRLFEQNPGGAPANLLCAAARLGLRTAFLGKVGDDMQGRFLKEALDGAGVDTGGLVWTKEAYTTLAFVALRGGERDFSFARKPGADTRLAPEEVDTARIHKSKIFHAGSLSLSDRPARDATMAALSVAKKAGAAISYDPNYRAPLWTSEREALRRMRAVLPFADLIKVSAEEAALLAGTPDPEQAARTLAADGAGIVVVTLGAEGALVLANGESRTVAGFEVPVLDTTGAGDAFWGGFLYKLLTSGRALKEITAEQAESFARFGNAVAALCITRRGGIPAMPTLEETERLLNQEVG